MTRNANDDSSGKSNQGPAMQDVGAVAEITTGPVQDMQEDYGYKTQEQGRRVRHDQ